MWSYLGVLRTSGVHRFGPLSDVVVMTRMTMMLGLALMTGPPLALVAAAWSIMVVKCIRIITIEYMLQQFSAMLASELDTLSAPVTCLHRPCFSRIHETHYE